MVRKPITRHRPKPSALNQKASDDTDPILKKPGVCGIMDVALNGRGVQPHLAALLNPLSCGIPDDQLVDSLPRGRPKLLDVLLKGRDTWPLAHPKPRKGTKRMRILQMEGQLLIAQIPVLLQYGTSKHLLGRHPLTARVRTLGPNHIPINQIIHAWIVIQNPRDGLQFSGNLVTWHGVKNAQLRNPFFTHLHPHRIEICPTISRSYCEDDTPNTMRIQQKNDHILN
jgi:hypothetical protein